MNHTAATTGRQNEWVKAAIAISALIVTLLVEWARRAH